jgi:type I restriction enzyme R subunit
MSGLAGAHLESTLETEIAQHLAANEWLYSPTDAGYDRELALFPEDVLAWVEESQPAEFAKVVRPQDIDDQRAAARRSILDRIAKSLDLDPLKNGGTIRILHEGFAMVPLHGGAVKFRMAQFRPATTQNLETLQAYAKMRVRVVRQVHYSVKHPNKALDLVLFVNGIPVATVELKTDFTQAIGNAVNQYRFDRSPAGEPLFGFAKRSLVHFAVSNSEVRMTTKLAGAATRFLPFNKGADGGAGNPANPGGSASSYFWEEVLQRDTWLQLLGSFVHLQVEVDVDPDTGKKTRTQKVLFPRYHQWRAVTRLLEAARVDGVGEDELDLVARSPPLSTARRPKPAGVRDSGRGHRPHCAGQAAAGRHYTVREAGRRGAVHHQGWGRVEVEAARRRAHRWQEHRHRDNPVVRGADHRNPEPP